MTLRGLLMPTVFLGTGMIATAANLGWSVREWQTDEGLPNNTVTSLAQTPDGFLWIATPGSLARFDGTQFELLTPSQIVPGYHQNARAFVTARDGSLWMATAHGPVVRVKTDNTVEIFTNQLPDLIVRQMIEDGEGGIWLAYAGPQLRRIKDGRVQAFSEAQGLPSRDYSLSLARDRKGKVWFTRGGYVGQYENGRFRVLTELRGMSRMQLAGSREGGVWICGGSRLFKYKAGGRIEEIGAYENGPSHSTPTQVLEDRDGNIWIGTLHGGLFCHTAGGFERIETSYPQIQCLMQDAEGDIWAGTGGGGLERIRPCVVKLEGAGEGLPFESVESICEDSNGTMWAVTQNGLLARRTGNGWHLAAANSGWEGQDASCVTADGRGTTWVGGRNELFRLRNGQWKSWGRGDGLACMYIHALLAAADGSLWVAGAGPDSLQRFEGGQWKNFTLPANAGFIRALVQDSAGDIWAGTTRGVLMRIHGNEARDETTNVFGGRTSVRAICATRDGSVWFGCASGGLRWLSGDGRTGRVTTGQGLPDDYLSQIIADDRGYLWFGSDHGIFKAREESLKAVAEGKSPGVECIQYGRNVGLPSLQANFGHWPTTARSRDGVLWMPMSTGLAEIDPRRDGADSSAPPVLLKRVVVDGKIVADYGKILPAQARVNLARTPALLRLAPRHSRLEFDWTALNLSAPENASFRYQLSGLDAHWIAAGSERKAGYSRLPAGNYLFKAEARNGDGPWREAPVLAISVAPFAWQTLWFKGLALAVFTAGVIAIVRYISFRRLRLKLQRFQQQAALDRERARIARDMHDDLGGRLTEIDLLLELAKRSRPEGMSGWMGKVATTARQAGESLDEIVWAVNPRHDTLPQLMDYLNRYAVQFSQAAGMRCRVDFPQEFPPEAMPPEARHHLFLTVKEALNNVVRHAGASEVRLRASLAGASLAIVIEDNGKGFDGVSGDLCADGLRNMRQRMEETGGQFEMESRPGAGTRISLTLKFPLKMKGTSSV